MGLTGDGYPVLGVLWRRRQWRLLSNLIDHLPRNSHFSEAVLADEQYAEAVIRQGLPEPKERISEWSPEREALAQVVDALHVLVQTSIAAGGGKPSAVTPSRRPETALDAARARDKERRYIELLGRILGHRPE